MKKTKFFMLILTVLFSLTPCLYAETLALVDSEVSFEVDSTLHAVHGEAFPDVGSVLFDTASAKFQGELEVIVPVERMTTNHKKRDKNMHKMFESEKYPNILFRAVSLRCESSQTVDYVCEVKAFIKIRDIEKEIHFPVLLKEESGLMNAEGEWVLNRDDFGLETPSVFGIIRVAKDIHIQFKTKWKPEQVL